MLVASAVAGIAALCVGLGSATQPGGEAKPSNPKMAATDALMRTLDWEVPTKDLPTSFFPLLDHLTEKARSTGREVTFFVDTKLFSKEVQAVIDGELPPPRFKLQPLPARMTIRAILQNAVTQFDGEEATFLIRQGRVEITTKKAAALASLLKQTFVASFDRQPLEVVLDEISDLTGVSIVLDGRAKEKARTLVTARFRNDVPLLEALQMVTECAELKLVELPGNSNSPRALFVTTPEHAQVLRR
jgi:hypothetical protein